MGMHWGRWALGGVIAVVGLATTLAAWTMGSPGNLQTWTELFGVIEIVGGVAAIFIP
jgi:hypothetical protein